MINENNDENLEEVEYTEEDRKQLHRRVFKMISIAGLTLVVLVVATYAWFIGITTVSVEQFQVEIETLQGLQISFNGSTFSNSASIEKTGTNAYDAMGIVNNHWVSDAGLTPVSTSGTFSSTGHLNLYENTSVTAITGGYRLRSNKVKNEVSEQSGTFDATTTSPEKDQYITFDLFLKNTTNTQNVNTSTSAYSRDEAEAIYLTTNSSVTLVTSGSDVVQSDAEKQNGIDNSVRIGMYQVAYAPLNTQASVLQSMVCTPASGDNYVGVCTESGVRANRNYTWNIWEPNDMRHIGKALTNYRKLCKVRTGENTYSGTCDTITDNSYVNTYAVNKVINVNAVNIYDGLNGYTATIGSNNYLYNTGTDTSVTPNTVGTFRSSQNTIDQSNVYNTNRSSILRLAPNSITKIRVYIWLEGQDIDNLEYMVDTAKVLRFSFGFTKDMFEETIPSPGE